MLRNPSPKEHTHLLLVVGTSQDVHDFLCPLTTTGIGVDIILTMPRLIILIRLSSSQLDASERTALDIRLYLQYPLDKLSIRGTETDTPARHIMTLRHRVELDTAVFGSRNLQNTQVLLAEDKGIGIIVHHHDVMILGKLYQSLVSGALCPSSCWHIGIVGPEKSDVRCMTDEVLQLVEVRLPTVVLTQIVVHHLGPQYLR